MHTKKKMQIETNSKHYTTTSDTETDSFKNIYKINFIYFINLYADEMMF